MRLSSCPDWKRFCRHVPWKSILVLGVVFLWCLSLWPPRRILALDTMNIGPADASAYALQARSLYQGDGLQVGYVTNFFHRYDPEIQRLDDHWPPLLSLFIAGAFHLEGASIQTAVLTTAFIGAFTLPLAVAWLAMSATRAVWTGWIAPLPFLLSDRILSGSLQVFSDQLLTVVVTLFLCTLLQSRNRPGWLLVSGLLIGVAWYGKGSQVLLFPLFLTGVLVIHGLRALLQKECLLGFLIALTIMYPRLWYNARHFGNPLHSTQSYVSSYFGLTNKTWTNWDMGFYSVYWDQVDPPGLRDRFQNPKQQRRSFRRNLERTVRMLTLGMHTDAKGWQKVGARPARLQQKWLGKEVDPKGDAPNWNPLHTWPEPSLTPFRLLGLLFGGLCILLLPITFFLHQGWLPVHQEKALFQSGTAPPSHLRARVEDAALLTGFLMSQGLFLALFWISLSRLIIPLLPAGIALSLMLPCLLIQKAIKAIRGRWPRKESIPRWQTGLIWSIWPVLTVIALSIFTAYQPAMHEHLYGETARIQKRKQKESRLPLLKEVLPEKAVLMTRHPWSLLLHLDGDYRAVGFPYAEPEVTLAIARYYRVDYLLPSGSRKPMSRFLKKHPDYVETVHENPLVYRIRYDQIPEEAFSSLEEVTPLWDPREEPMPR